MSGRKVKVFLSSPKAGLEDARAKLLEIQSTEPGLDFAAMEFFPASPDHPRDVCLREVALSEFVIILFGPYYGSIDVVSGKSNTEIEYDEATRCGINTLVFVPKGWRPIDDDEEARIRHQSFFEKIKGSRWYKEYDSIDALKLLFYEAYRERLKVILSTHGPLVGYKEYYSAFLDETKLFTHCYPIKGRAEELSKLMDFANSDTEKICSVVGRGGSGKSKLIYEFAKAYEAMPGRKSEILFVRENFDLNEEGRKRLLGGNYILIVDDAHRYTHIKNVLGLFSNSDFRKRIKLVLGYRPSGSEYIRGTLSLINLDSSEIKVIQVNDLKRKDIRKIAAEILGNNDDLVNYVAEMTKDCPLATVIGSKLIKIGEIAPNKINNSSEFQRIVLSRVISDIHDSLQKSLPFEQALRYIAALSPITNGDKDLYQKLAKLLGIEQFTLIEMLDVLQSKGIVALRGHLLRIAPDLLSDNILYTACVSNSGQATGFSETVFKQFSETHAANILANISEIEWRARADNRHLDLLAYAWKNIQDSFKKANNFERTQILKWLDKACIFQPNKSMDIVRLALKPSTAKIKKSKHTFILRKYSHEDVVQLLPDLLSKIAYHHNHVEECASLLWQLSKTDARDLNPYPGHPFRRLQELAAYQPRKSVAFNQMVCDVIENILKEEDAFSHKNSPVAVLEKFLAKEIEYSDYEEGSFTLSARPLHIDNVRPLRQRTLNLLAQIINKNSSNKAIGIAAQALLNALGYSMPSFGRKASPKETNEWHKEQLQIISILHSKIKVINTPSFHFLVKNGLAWYQKNAREDKLRAAVRKLLKAIPENDSLITTQAFIPHRRDDEYEADWETRQKKTIEEMRRAKNMIVRAEKTAPRIMAKLTFILGELNEFGISCNPKPLLAHLATENPEIAISIYKLLLRSPHTPIARHSSALLYPLGSKKEYKSELSKLIRSGLASKDKTLCWNIAYAYAWGGMCQDYSQELRTNLLTLIKMEDETTTEFVTNAISRIGESGKIKEALSLLTALNLSSQMTADNAFAVFGNGKHGIHFDSLTEKDIKVLLAKLSSVTLANGHNYHVEQFLEYTNKKYAHLGIGFLFDRYELLLKRRKMKGQEGFAPIPYLGFDKAFVGISKHPDYQIFLNKYWLLITRKEMDVFWLPKLTETLSDGYSTNFLKYLSDKLKRATPKQVEYMAFTLRDAEDGFLFSNHDFVSKLLNATPNIETYRSVKSSLHSIAVGGSVSRGFGQPSAKSQLLITKGKEVSSLYEAMPKVREFYLEILNYGEELMKKEVAQDEEEAYR